MKKLNIGLLGLGTVGTGTAKILIENKEIIKKKTGANLHLKKAADIDLNKKRGVVFEKGTLTNDVFEVINDDKIDIIVEMIGGKTIAKEFIIKALKNKKHVVTANKALLAEAGEELFELAYKNGVDIAYEASVGGAIPIIKSIRESLAGNNITAVNGILNGTCNYILSQIANKGMEFKDALAQAQANGYAEADPTFDIEGFDTAHKTAIIASLAYGTKINFDDLYIEGITGITKTDIKYAKEFGYLIKLLAITKDLGNSIEARIHPTMIPINNMLAKIDGSLNAISVFGDAVGELMLCGYGAGMMPTASAVVGDIIDIARNILFNAKTRIPIAGFMPAQIKSKPVTPIEDILTNYYFRFFLLDKPNVLSLVAGILGAYGISIKSVHQKERNPQEGVPVIIITHLAKEAEVKKALKEISALDIVLQKPVFIRIEDDEK
ncbi:MAG: homoserine dehydrogenase [Deltaproteobacteria bacterium]|nr:homoserine dehydrogenase [Deltaproteobacteria bacterium]